eukprot:12199233-Alexandrium_andersonii.AAC.1
MGAGAFEPDPSERDADEQELQAAFVVAQCAFRPTKGRGEGGEPSAADSPGAPATTVGAKGGGEG